HWILPRGIAIGGRDSDTAVEATPTRQSSEAPAADRPPRTRSIIWRLNSGVYRTVFSAIVKPSLTLRCPLNQVNSRHSHSGGFVPRAADRQFVRPRGERDPRGPRRDSLRDPPDPHAAPPSYQPVPPSCAASCSSR